MKIFMVGTGHDDDVRLGVTAIGLTKLGHEVFYEQFNAITVKEIDEIKPDFLIIRNVTEGFFRPLGPSWFFEDRLTCKPIIIHDVDTIDADRARIDGHFVIASSSKLCDRYASNSLNTFVLKSGYNDLNPLWGRAWKSHPKTLGWFGEEYEPLEPWVGHIKKFLKNFPDWNLLISGSLDAYAQFKALPENKKKYVPMTPYNLKPFVIRMVDAMIIAGDPRIDDDRMEMETIVSDVKYTKAEPSYEVLVELANSDRLSRDLVAETRVSRATTETGNNLERILEAIK